MVKVDLKQEPGSEGVHLPTKSSLAPTDIHSLTTGVVFISYNLQVYFQYLVAPTLQEETINRFCCIVIENRCVNKLSNHATLM